MHGHPSGQAIEGASVQVGATFQAKSIGIAALAALTGDFEGSVLGTTSRGVFLECRPGRVVFISFEAHRGPLTINIPEGALACADLSPGAHFHSRAGKLSFPTTGAALAYSGVKPWLAPPPAFKQLDREGLLGRCREVTRLVLAGQAAREGMSLLWEAACHLGWEVPSAPGGGEPDRLERERLAGDFDRLRATLARLLDQGVELDPSPFAVFLGRGRGLTPAGDDLLLGILLLYSRWGQLFWPGMEPPAQFNQLTDHLVKLAVQKTTTLSANLIECAAQGQTDERLILAFEGLLTGSPRPDECAALLLSWGSSSGGDALAGAALAISNIG